MKKSFNVFSICTGALLLCILIVFLFSNPINRDTTYLKKANAYFDSGEYEKSLSMYKKINDPSISALWNKAICERKTNHYTNALGTLNRIENLLNNTKDEKQLVYLYYERVENLNLLNENKELLLQIDTFFSLPIINNYKNFSLPDKLKVEKMENMTLDILFEQKKFNISSSYIKKFLQKYSEHPLSTPSDESQKVYLSEMLIASLKYEKKYEEALKIVNELLLVDNNNMQYHFTKATILNGWKGKVEAYNYLNSIKDKFLNNEKFNMFMQTYS